MDTLAFNGVVLVKSPRRTVGVEFEVRPDGFYSAGFSHHATWGMMDFWRGPYPSQEASVRSGLCLLGNALQKLGVVEDVRRIEAYLARIPSLQAEFAFD